MKRNKAIKIIHNALIGYVEDCAGENSPEAQQIEKAWDTLNKGIYQVRIKGDGEFEYFIVPPMEDEHNYDPENLKEASECAKERGGWVVKIIEERL
jgi:hypothetical protein